MPYPVHYSTRRLWRSDGSALCETKLKALNNNVCAQLEVGYRYEFGNGVLKDLKEALFWYRLALEVGSFSAAKRIADLQSVVEHNNADVPKLCRGAAEFYHDMLYRPEYTYNTYLKTCVALTQLMGIGVDPNVSSARKLLEEAVSLKMPEALCVLGRSYWNQRFGNKDEEKAVESFHVAASAGYPEAEVHLADILRYGRGAPQNRNAAMFYYQKAAERGHPDAQYGLSCFKRYGFCCQMDQSEALNLARLAAQQGHKDAQVFLGQHMKIHGSTDESFQWSMQAAQQGDGNAQFEVGNAYSQGLGSVTKNEKLAKFWYKKAADNDHALARHLLGSQKR
eukprot:Plantae.Rhodophyta-Purpureofilum_apyrenoidigerum.ctg13584.p1 GENE.Plantae.Rhodophyta-Purpureofilum_apyrenoidigerum.ctg13584~~Plantae.Rhodophyta-Purpureofilum_apyrenoidigerum.ctg13584.p1  ORF type:complete len:337 (-),score=43.92 Plantae.Rhodophyta-Purpureofilum_apyrenoidigerum.ctg13584:713-1723(-)